jgi:4-coumarate--CoA ligase
MPAFDLKLFLTTIQKHKVTYIYVAPPVVLHLAKSKIVEEYDLSSIRMMTSGAAPLTKDLILEVHKRLGLKVKQAYGLSETSPVSHMQAWDDSWKTLIGSVGPALPGLECKNMDPEGKEVPKGKEGELWIRGPTVFKGYHNNDSATSECMSDGFFKTGDIAIEDKEGNLFITDRVKELIKYKGSQVAPAELEGLLLGHKDVDDVAIIGFHVEEIASEVPMAFVVLKEGRKPEEATAKEIVEWLGERTSKTKLLRGGVVFVDEVPKSASGKILRRVLKGMSTGKDAKKAMGAVDYSTRGSKL